MGRGIRTALAGGSAALVAAATLATAAPVTASSCKHMTLGGKHVCVKAGDRCKRKYEKKYNQHKLSCSRQDKHGHWRLRKAHQYF